MRLWMRAHALDHVAEVGERPLGVASSWSRLRDADTLVPSSGRINPRKRRRSPDAYP
jgi:hypothetical protein